MISVKILTSLLLGAAWLIGYSDGAKILMLMPVAPRSHQNVFTPLANGLAERGHDLTIVGMQPRLGEAMDRVKELVVPGIKEAYDAMSVQFFQQQSAHQFFTAFRRLYENATDIFLNSDIAKQLHKNDKKAYDLVIVNGVANEFVFPIADSVAQSIMLLLTVDMLPTVAYTMGMPLSPAAFPVLISLRGPHMTFFQRAVNCLFSAVSILSTKLYLHGCIDREVAKNFPDLAKIADISVSFVLSNADPVFGFPRPNLPNVVNVGGMHCRDPRQIIEGDLADFVNGASAEDGFILLSFGSVLKGDNIPAAALNAFKSAFARIPQRVVWKFESPLPDLPSNVRIFQWLPQQDLLGHEKIRLFITHSGLLSLQETIYHGVPVVGVPVFADQFSNIARVEALGFGRSLDLHNITEDTVFEVMHDVLSNSRYKNMARKYALIRKDQPESPLSRAIFWTEYVIRHQGAPHLRNTAALELNFIQYFLLDVIAVAVIVLVVVIYVLWRIMKLAIHTCKWIQQTRSPLSENFKMD